MPSYGATNYDFTGANVHQDLSSYGSYSSYQNAVDLNVGMNHGFNDAESQHTFGQPVSISEHVEITKPVVIPVVRNVGKISLLIAINYI